jgi:5-amino-6-(5-phosphoribosylamino)uracil reductase
MQYQRLYPDPRQVELEELLDELRLAERASGDAPVTASGERPSTASGERPYTIANFVTSVDGRATFKGRSGRLGDDGDRALFHGLREQVDAVIVGTRTLGTERYGRLIPRPERRERRKRRGLRIEPVACLVTRSGDVPTDVPLFAEPEALVVVFTGVAIEARDYAADVEVIRLDPGELMLTTALRRLHSDLGIRTLLCEGGPRLFGALVREHLVDELFMTLGPKLVGGGSGPTMTSGPELSELQQVRLIWALERQGSLFLRYAVS